MMVPEWLSLIDVAFFAVALLFALGGLQKGFASQVAHIATFAALGALLFFAYPAIFTYMSQLFNNLNETYMMWLILAGLIVLAIVFYMLFSKLLATALKMQISDRSDRSFGFILGLARGAMVALFVMVFMVILGSENIYNALSEKSWVGQFVCYEAAPRIQPHMNKSTVGDSMDKIREALIHQEEAGLPDEE